MKLKTSQRKTTRPGGNAARPDAIRASRPFAPPAPLQQPAAAAPLRTQDGRSAPEGHHLGRVGVRPRESARGRAAGGGLPDGLRAGIEKMSGVSLADVRVHYDSPRPARLKARAYTQGSEIHVAAGQERHLAHEAWHVVQQKRGRVRATARLGGAGVNTSEALEREADRMGARAAAGGRLNIQGRTRSLPKTSPDPLPGGTQAAAPIQAKWIVTKGGERVQVDDSYELKEGERDDDTSQQSNTSTQSNVPSQSSSLPQTVIPQQIDGPPVNDGPPNVSPSSVAPSNVGSLNNDPPSSVSRSDLPPSVSPSNVVPSSSVSQIDAPQRLVPSNFVPQGIVPQGIVPQGIMPSNIVPSSFLPSSYFQSRFFQSSSSSSSSSSSRSSSDVPSVSRSREDDSRIDIRLSDSGSSQSGPSIEPTVLSNQPRGESPRDRRRLSLGEESSSSNRVEPPLNLLSPPSSRRRGSVHQSSVSLNDDVIVPVNSVPRQQPNDPRGGYGTFQNPNPQQVAVNPQQGGGNAQQQPSLWQRFKNWFSTPSKGEKFATANSPGIYTGVAGGTGGASNLLSFGNSVNPNFNPSKATNVMGPAGSIGSGVGDIAAIVRSSYDIHNARQVLNDPTATRPERSLARSQRDSGAVDLSTQLADTGSQTTNLVSTFAPHLSTTLTHVAPMVSAPVGLAVGARALRRGYLAHQHVKGLENVNRDGMSQGLWDAKEFSQGQAKKRRWRNVLGGVGAGLGVGGGLALGLGALGVVGAAATPVGWALAGLAGAIGLGLGAYKLGRWAYKKYKGRQNANQGLGAERETHATALHDAVTNNQPGHPDYDHAERILTGRGIDVNDVRGRGGREFLKRKLESW